MTNMMKTEFVRSFDFIRHVKANVIDRLNNSSFRQKMIDDQTVDSIWINHRRRKRRIIVDQQKFAKRKNKSNVKDDRLLLDHFFSKFLFDDEINDKSF